MPRRSAAIDYAPLWSDRYARILFAHQDYNSEFPFKRLKGDPLPAGLKQSDLDSFSTTTSLSRHSHGLLSAGVIARDDPRRLARRMHNTISERPRRFCYVLGDSGGYQILNSGLVVTDEWRRNQLRWSELYCDAAVPLDVPSRAVVMQGSRYFGKFRLALRDTVDSHEYWQRHYVGSTRMRRLLVLQGQNKDQAETWYDVMVRRKQYLQQTDPWVGIAFGGDRRKHLGHIARLMLWLRADRVLDKIEHIHVLGFASFGYAICLSMLKRAIEEEIGRPILVTFDVSTPFQYGYIFQQVVLGVDWSGKQPTMKTMLLGHPTREWDAFSGAPLPGSSLGLRGLTMADLRRKPHPDYQGWDDPGRIMLCHHNMDAMANAIILANQVADVEDGGGIEEITGLKNGLIRKELKQVRCVLRNLFKWEDPEGTLSHHWSKLGMFARDEGEDDR